MKKMTALSLTICSFLQICFAQTLIVQGEKGNLYLTHKVVPRENWYSVGRLYNISPKEIAPFNNSALSTPLSIGQQLKIPLTEINFSQTGEKDADESLVPVYHTFQSNETLNKISATYNAVPLSSLEVWNNNLKKENLKTGSRLIIGYLKVKTSLSALATSAKKVSPISMNKEPLTEETVAPAKENKKVSPAPEKKQPVS
ncbi:MAG TPA: LysM peptidoglycan-binding domain-containing protein, partial [Puia sp.]|nr:LysM peptidoglycan-binding domain-containing protein [Puia sp.]